MSIYRFVRPVIVHEIWEVKARSEDEARCRLFESVDRQLRGTEVETWDSEVWAKQFGDFSSAPILCKRDGTDAEKKAFEVWNT